MALACAIVLFLGFLPSYFHRSAELPPLSRLYQLHGALFTAWIVLLVAQTALVAGRCTDIHRTLGLAGAFLAAVVFVLGVAVSVDTLRRNGGPPAGDPRKLFAVPLGDIIVFGVLVGAAILQRQDSDKHMRLMLLATISLLTAAVARFLRQVGMGGAPNLFFGAGSQGVPPLVSECPVLFSNSARFSLSNPIKSQAVLPSWAAKG
jgi:FtsH-binding integral membrane protein